VRSAGSARVSERVGIVCGASARLSSSSLPASSTGSAGSSPSSVSTTLMPMSDSIAIVSSICSEETSSAGSTELSSS
jgi:hypothetical protein